MSIWVTYVNSGVSICTCICTSYMYNTCTQHCSFPIIQWGWIRVCCLCVMMCMCVCPRDNVVMSRNLTLHSSLSSTHYQIIGKYSSQSGSVFHSWLAPWTPEAAMLRNGVGYTCVAVCLFCQASTVTWNHYHVHTHTQTHSLSLSPLFPSLSLSYTQVHKHSNIHTWAGGTTCVHIYLYTTKAMALIAFSRTAAVG